VIALGNDEIQAANEKTIAAMTFQEHAVNLLSSSTLNSPGMHMSSEESSSSHQRRFRGHLHVITAFAVSPCGQYVASASVGATESTSL